MMAAIQTVYGVGINDAAYSIRPTAQGSKFHCPFYQTWARMLERCYSKSYQKKRPTYVGCLVCEDWLTFSNFKAWMETQDWKGKQLDKDLLVYGNKVYSPETCAFVTRLTNSFITDSKANRGEYLIGVCLNKEKGKFQAECSNPFTKKTEYLGYFADQQIAHEAWRKRKHELACQLADTQSDERVADALRGKYNKQQGGTE